MPAEPVSDDPFAPVDVKLKAPGLAAFLAWTWPGAGHLYQGRTGKGLLFMICILFTYFWGLAIGGGHVVYASFERPAIRYPYIFQLGVGIPALPAAIQAMGDKPVLGTKFMAPPAGPVQESRHDELASWHDETGFFFELGTLYTMIAGLLNVLVIYDAYSGPVFIRPGQHGKKEKAKTENDQTGSEHQSM